MSRLLIAAAVGLICCSHAPAAPEPAPQAAAAAEKPPPAPAGAKKKAREATGEEKAWFEVLKNAIGPAWVSRLATAVDANDPEGCRDFMVERRLVVEFVVNADGIFASARVRDSSGLPYVDKVGPETFTAVHRVAPPPKSLAGRKLPFEFNVNVRPNPYTCGK